MLRCVFFLCMLTIIEAVTPGCAIQTTAYTASQLGNWAGFTMAHGYVNGVDYFSNICNYCECVNTWYGITCPTGEKVLDTCNGHYSGVSCNNWDCSTLPCTCQKCEPGSSMQSWYGINYLSNPTLWYFAQTNPNTWTGSFYTRYRTVEYCLACSAGNYSSAGTSCSPCPTGSACAGTGTTTPTQCTGGTYTSTTGQQSCSQCSGGTYSGAGASACTPCDIGYYSGASAGSCSPCTNRPGNALAYTSSASSNSCGYSSTPSCPAGTYAEQSSSSCKPCTSGTYQGSTTTSWATGCVTCPAGSQCPSGGLTSATPCANGFFSNAGFTVCTIICAAGRFANFGQSVCSTCNAGTFS